MVRRRDSGKEDQGVGRVKFRRKDPNTGVWGGECRLAAPGARFLGRAAATGSAKKGEKEGALVKEALKKAETAEAGQAVGTRVQHTEAEESKGAGKGGVLGESPTRILAPKPGARQEESARSGQERSREKGTDGRNGEGEGPKNLAGLDVESKHPVRFFTSPAVARGKREVRGSQGSRDGLSAPQRFAYNFHCQKGGTGKWSKTGRLPPRKSLALTTGKTESYGRGHQ